MSNLKNFENSQAELDLISDKLNKRDEDLIKRLENMSKITDSVARKILMGRGYSEYKNYKNYINESSFKKGFIGDKFKIANVKSSEVRFTIKTDSYWSKHLYSFVDGREFIKTIPISLFFEDDRSIARKSRANIYQYLLNGEDTRMRELHSQDIKDAQEIAQFKKQIVKLEKDIEERKDILSNANYRLKSHKIWFYHKIYGNPLPKKDRGLNFPEVTEDKVSSVTKDCKKNLSGNNNKINNNNEVLEEGVR